MEENCIIAVIRNMLYIPAFLVAIGLESRIAESIAVLLILMIADVFTGIARTWKIRGGQSIQSSVMTFGVVTKLLILLVPILIALAGKGIHMDLSLLVVGTVNILILSEVYSNISNIQSFRIGKDIKEFDAVSLLLKQIRDVLLLMIEKQKIK